MPPQPASPATGECHDEVGPGGGYRRALHSALGPGAAATKPRLFSAPEFQPRASCWARHRAATGPQVGLQGVMLTVQKASTRALAFYTQKCKYAVDEISPSLARTQPSTLRLKYREP